MGFTTATSKFEVGGTLSAASEADAAIFVNNHGPYTRASGTIATDATEIVVDAASGGKALADFNNADFTNGKVTLTETFAGGQLLELCSSCVTATGDFSDAANSIFTVNKALSVNKGDQL